MSTRGHHLSLGHNIHRIDVINPLGAIQITLVHGINTDKARTPRRAWCAAHTNRINHRTGLGMLSSQIDRQTQCLIIDIHESAESRHQCQLTGWAHLQFGRRVRVDSRHFSMIAIGKFCNRPDSSRSQPTPFAPFSVTQEN